MTTTRKNIELPAQYKVVQMLTCDGCGLEVEEVPGSIAHRIGWLQQIAYEEDGQGAAPLNSLADYCTDCRPKIERAHTQEATAIRAEKVAAKAEVSGVA